MIKSFRIKGNKLYHHIYAWGNDRHPVFKDDTHYKKYLEYLALYGCHYKVAIIAYALMAWHVHLFIFDLSGKLSQFMENLHGHYARYFNKITGRVGHVFGKRFNNKVVQVNNYGLWLSRYIHRQPIEAGLVRDPKDYPWTSYRAYLDLVPKGFLKPEIIWEQFGAGREVFSRYETFVLGGEEDLSRWTDPSVMVIGDKDFTEKFRITKDPVENEIGELNKSDFEDLMRRLAECLGVKFESLLKPKGRDEQRMRHNAFRILIREYGLSVRRVAHLFKVSPTAIVKVLRNKNGKP